MLWGTGSSRPRQAEPAYAAPASKDPKDTRAGAEEYGHSGHGAAGQAGARREWRLRAHQPGPGMGAGV